MSGKKQVAPKTTDHTHQYVAVVFDTHPIRNERGEVLGQRTTVTKFQCNCGAVKEL